MKLGDLLKSATRLRDLGPQSMETQDEAWHIATSTLDLMIELLEALNDAPEAKPQAGE